jgi:hypothetical protein
MDSQTNTARNPTLSLSNLKTHGLEASFVASQDAKASCFGARAYLDVLGLLLKSRHGMFFVDHHATTQRTQPFDLMASEVERAFRLPGEDSLRPYFLCILF